MKKIIWMVMVASAILATSCIKQEENKQTNDAQPALIKARVVYTKAETVR